jgi:hypothetical protein
MADLVPELLTNLSRHRLPGIDLGEGFVYPDYSGHSVLNVPTSVCQWLGVPALGVDPLESTALTDLAQGSRHIVLVLMDALALHRLRGWIKEGITPLWGSLAEEGVLLPLTSITPSTTSAALTSLWTGCSPAVHGTIGYEMWLKEYGVVANTILHAPISFQGDAGSLKRAGFNPENFLNLPTLGSHMHRYGVQAYAFQHKSIVRSGLSQSLMQDVNVHSYNTVADLWVNVRKTLEGHIEERNYLWVYWSEVDQFSHLYGPDDERTVEEFAAFTAACERLFLERLSPTARQDTLFILMADHGQIVTQPDPHYDLRNNPNLTRRLHILPTGENRLASLYIRPGQVEAVREYIERVWPNQFTTLDPAFAIDAGLFGPGTPHSRLLDRLGDLLVVARGEAYFWWSNKEDHLYGRHGGLSPGEMLVPFLAVKMG